MGEGRGRAVGARRRGAPAQHQVPAGPGVLQLADVQRLAGVHRGEGHHGQPDAGRGQRDQRVQVAGPGAESGHRGVGGRRVRRSRAAAATPRPARPVGARRPPGRSVAVRPVSTPPAWPITTSESSRSGSAVQAGAVGLLVDHDAQVGGPVGEQPHRVQAAPLGHRDVAVRVLAQERDQAPGALAGAWRSCRPAASPGRPVTGRTRPPRPPAARSGRARRGRAGPARSRPAWAARRAGRAPAAARPAWCSRARTRALAEGSDRCIRRAPAVIEPSVTTWTNSRRSIRSYCTSLSLRPQPEAGCADRALSGRSPGPMLGRCVGDRGAVAGRAGRRAR